MKHLTAIALTLIAAPAASALAQDSTLPESMRIQQSVTQQNANDPNMPANRGSSQPTTEAPGSAAGPVERHRLDPAAPSPQRLQIEDGTSAAVRNPDADTLHPGPSGSSYNTIMRGAPSTSGTSTGTTGIGSSPGTGASSVGAGAGGSAGDAGGSAGGGASGGGH